MSSKGDVARTGCGDTRASSLATTIRQPIMTYPEWRDAFWAELERVMGVPGTIINDDQRQIGGWIITSEPWAASYAVVTHAEVLPLPAASVVAGGVDRFALVVDFPKAAARRFATTLRAKRPDLCP